MSHFAQIDENNVVVRVLVGDNNDSNGDEGYQWLIDNLGGRWIKTSYNHNIRGVFAATGYTYNEDEDIFIQPKPFESWIREGSKWVAPKAYPNDGNLYLWDEDLGDWVNGETV